MSWSWEYNLLLTQLSIEDNSALQAKVDEALTVYDEYVKNNKGGEGEAGEGDVKDEKSEEKA
jgi:polyadenylate-binding protein